MTTHETIQISENLDDLKHREQHYTTAGKKARIQFLMLLKEERGTIEELGEILGKSPRTLYRWLEAYREGGFPAMMGEEPQQTTRISTNELNALRDELVSGEMESLQDIQQWLKEQFGLEYSIRGVSDLVNRRLGARRVWRIDEKDAEEAAQQPDINHNPPTSAELDDKYLHLLNNMPVDFDIKSWIEKFRGLLLELFDDVDRITVNVNTNCWLLEPEKYDPGFTIAQDAHSVNRLEQKQKIWVESHRDNQSPSESLLKAFKEQGYPLEKYHSPIFYDYYFKSSAYIGTIFLWRDKNLKKTGPSTLNHIRSMESFIIFALTDLIVRHHYANPTERAFYDALHIMSKETGISPQEQNAVSYRLLGYSYKEIASELRVSQDTVKKLLQSVYRKTDTRAHVELFAKYFTPRIVPQKDS